LPLDLGIACYTILSVTDKKVGRMSHEEVIAECPANYFPKNLLVFEATSDITLDSENLKVRLT
jgi:hypothetical protein